MGTIDKSAYVGDNFLMSVKKARNMPVLACQKDEVIDVVFSGGLRHSI